MLVIVCAGHLSGSSVNIQHAAYCGSYCHRKGRSIGILKLTSNPRCRSHLALAHFASHRCGPSSIPGLGRGRMCEKFNQLLAVSRWFPPGTPVSSTRKLISSSSSFHRLDMTLAVAEALNPNKPNQTSSKDHLLYRTPSNLGLGGGTSATTKINVLLWVSFHSFYFVTL